MEEKKIEKIQETSESPKKKSRLKELTEQVEQLNARVSELEEILNTTNANLTEANEKYLRLLAEFDNYRKRRDKEVELIKDYAGEEIFRQLLGIYDDLERAVLNASSEDNEKTLRDAIELIYKKFSKFLKDNGVEPFDSLNQPFDPNIHDAIMQKEVEGVPPETVVEEFEKGYKYRNRVLRYAKVVVSK